MAPAVPATSPVNAPWPVVRFQNIPSKKVANSGALTNAKTSCSASIMLLKLVTAYAAPIDSTIPPIVAIRPIHK